MARVFISYRRDDSKWEAREVYRSLRQVLPRDHVFMDIDSIPPGADFVDVLEGWVDKCDILLALIGTGWIDAVDPKTGLRRLENPNDFVRIELRKGLARGISVVPVLLDGAEIPHADQLPDDLKRLTRRNAEFILHRTVDSDVERLIKKLGLKQDSNNSEAAPSSAPTTPSSGPRTGSSQAAKIMDATTATFARDVVEASKSAIVLVDFWAPWCGPCKQLTPVLEKVALSYKGQVHLVKLNTDEHPAIAGQLKIQSLPTVWVFQNGHPVEGFVGVQPESQVRMLLDRLISSAGKA